MLLKKYFKLSAKINLVIGCVLLSFMTIAGLIMSDYYSKTLIKNSEIRGVEIAALFAKINSLPLSRMDYYSIENNTKELLKNQDIVYAETYDKSDFKISNTDQKNKDVPLEHILVSKEKIYFENKEIGYIKVGLSLESTYQNVHNAKIILFSILLGAIIITVISLSMLMRMIIKKPMEHLLDSVKIISGGNLYHSVTIMANDEIGQLSEQFNEMTKKLRSSLRLINDVVEAMPSILISTDETGLVTIWNKAATEFFGISAESAINKNLWELSDELKKYQPCFEEVVATMLHKEMYHEVFKKSDFKYKNISIFPLVDQGIKGVVIRIDDITDLEKSEQQLRQMQKMETVGTLAGGLAHDFNNVLGGIIGTVSILQHKIRKNIEISKEELIEHIATMEQSGQRSVDMVQQLLTLSRKQDLCFAPVDLNYTLRHVLKICQNTFDKCIELVPQFSSSPAMVNADPTQLEQVLLNLCVNGYHSMTIMKNEGEHQGGMLTISIGNFAADNFFCHLNPDAEKIVYWVLSVIDSGVGIDLKTQSKIFDPFYTTKEKGKGTGLGLAMVYNIVKQHHGFIKVYSEIGIGSTFNVYLPALIRGKEISQASIEEEDIPRGAGTVLVIDDEPVMRKLAAEVLRECGYETILAENGIEGLEIFKKEKAKIKLVLLDMVMPKMSGEEVFKEIKAISQDAKIILVSGFKQDNRIESVLKSGATAFIQKPYTLEKLAKVIDKAVSFSQE